MQRFLEILVLAFLASGCTTTTLTNLTPKEMPRNPNGLYQFEVIWDSNQQSIVKDSIKGYVVIGTEMFSMKKTPLLKNRWEGLVPIPADKDLVNYYYKFDYQYRSFPDRRYNSKLSPPYELKIVNPEK